MHLSYKIKLTGSKLSLEHGTNGLYTTTLLSNVNNYGCFISIIHETSFQPKESDNLLLMRLPEVSSDRAEIRMEDL